MEPVGKSGGSFNSYDSELQMFCEAGVEPRPATLRFYRWLAERGALEHPVFGPPAGEWVHEAAAAAEGDCETHPVSSH
jgi:hypothetical protein